MNNIQKENRSYIGTAKEIKYEKLVRGNWVEIDPMELKKADTFRCIDKYTGRLLETEHGDWKFTLYRDYDGKKRLPQADYVL